jgi:hypothetical protein
MGDLMAVSARTQSMSKQDQRGVCGQIHFLTLLWGVCFLFVLLLT